LIQLAATLLTEDILVHSKLPRKLKISANFFQQPIILKGKRWKNLVREWKTVSN